MKKTIIIILVGIIGTLAACSSPPVDSERGLFLDLLTRYQQHQEAVAKKDEDAIKRLNGEIGALAGSKIDTLIRLAGEETGGADDRALEHKIVAAAALGMIRTEAFTEYHDSLLAVLSAALDDGNNDVRINAAGSLGHLKLAKTPFDKLASLLNDPDPQVRRAASYGLYLALPPRSNDKFVPVLIKALSDSDLGVRINTTMALGSIGSVQAVDPLIKESLHNSDPTLRKNAAFALASLQFTTLNPNPQEQLVELLGGIDEKTAQEAWDTLARINRVNTVLIELLRERDTELVQSAAEALKGLNQTDPGRAYANWKNWFEGKVRSEKDAREAGVRKRKELSEKESKEKKPETPQAPPPPHGQPR